MDSDLELTALPLLHYPHKGGMASVTPLDVGWVKSHIILGLVFIDVPLHKSCSSQDMTY